MNRLHRDPSALRTALLAQHECATTGAAATSCLLATITDLYTTHLVPADLEAATWRVLAGELDLQLLGTALYRVGRSVEGIGLPSSGSARERFILLIDSTTGGYTGYENALLSGTIDGVEAPAVEQFTTLLSAS